MYQPLTYLVNLLSQLLQRAIAVWSQLIANYEAQSSTSTAAVDKVHSMVTATVNNREELNIPTTSEFTPRSPPPSDNSTWRSTGSYFGAPRIRSRPIYPKLPHDGHAEKGKSSKKTEEAELCGKYYSRWVSLMLEGE